MNAADENRLVEQALLSRSAMTGSGLAGHDPYDALLSPLFDWPVFRSSRLLRFSAQQAVLRSPVNLRPLLRVPEQLNPVTIGLYLHGIADLAEAGAIDADQARTESETWTRRLEELTTPGLSGPAWGYPFPWEGRRHRMPTGTPTVVATSMIVNGLHRSWRQFGHESARQLIIDTSRFVLRDLPRATGDDRAFCWSYSPEDHQVVLNATLKGSRMLAQSVDAGLTEERELALSAAEASARFVCKHQEDGGGWPYAAEGDPRTWRDHHHTGYVLECLRAYAELTGDRQFDSNCERGWEYYRSSFFDGDLPCYYDDRPGPIDATAAGQALITLTLFGDEDFAYRVAQASSDALRRPDGTYSYQRKGNRLTRTHFIHWSTAWMFTGLSALIGAKGTAA